RPGGCAPVGAPLEGDAGPVGCIPDHHPVPVVLHPDHAQQFLVEIGEGRRLRAVDDEAVPASAHRGIVHAGSYPGRMRLVFSGEVWFWRAPAPWHFITVPDDDCAALEAASASVSYGWGMIPAVAQIGAAE